MGNTFFAMLARLKLINRWALMRKTREENLAEHSLDVAILAHALGLIAKKRLGKVVDEKQAVLMALFHDATEIITGDMPTPIKYLNPSIKEAYKEVEKGAAEQLLRKLPEDLEEEYRKILLPDKESYAYEKKLVKAADKLSAYLKCIEEKKTGNLEFLKAEEALEASLLSVNLEEVRIFLKEFLPSYGKTLDEL